MDRPRRILMHPADNVAIVANDGGLGGVEKLGGLVLGAATGVIIGCLPIMVINAVPALYNWAPTKQLMRESFFLKTYAPIAAKIVPPRKR